MLEVAGATAGLAAIVYFAGSLALWIRLHKAGYPAEIALEHQARSEVVAVGLRGLLFVTGIFVALALVWRFVILGAGLLGRWIEGSATRTKAASRLKRVYLLAAEWLVRVGLAGALVVLAAVDQRVVGVGLIAVGAAAFATTLMATPDRSPLRLGGLALAVAGASLVSWRTFGVVLAMAAMLALSVLAEGTAWRRVLGSATAIVVLGLAAVIATVSWEIDGTVRWQGVYLSPVPDFIKDGSRVPENLDYVAFPYFGETSDWVFVADVRNPRFLSRQKRWEWDVCCGRVNKRIVEVKRSEVRLSFPGEKNVLYFSREPPATSLWNYLKREF